MMCLAPIASTYRGWRLKAAPKGLAATKPAYAGSPHQHLPCSLRIGVNQTSMWWQGTCAGRLGGGTPLAAIFSRQALSPAGTMQKGVQCGF
jgi:hypothetical protein